MAKTAGLIIGMHCIGELLFPFCQSGVPLSGRFQPGRPLRERAGSCARSGGGEARQGGQHLRRVQGVAPGEAGRGRGQVREGQGQQQPRHDRASGKEEDFSLQGNELQYVMTRY